jgi:hypothetical protein
MTEKDSKKAIGGAARAAALSPERRSEIARKAAASRWDGELPIATHEGEFKLGDSVVSCAVLPSGLRVITQATFLRSIGRSRSPKAGTGVLSTVDDLPFFLQAEALKPFISEDLAMSTTPIFYRSVTGSKGVGYDARLLPQVAEVYLKFRDSKLTKNEKIPTQYAHIIKASDILMRGLASVGIISLVDEATGFQRDRAKDALERILEEFIAKELRPWVKTFPEDFYSNLFRLRGLQFPKDTVSRPKYFGHLTNDIVYRRLAPKVLDELKKATPRNENGSHKYKLFQKLTDDVGHPKLRDHLTSVVTLMKISSNYQQFLQHLDVVHPRYGDTLLVPFEENSSDDKL